MSFLSTLVQRYAYGFDKLRRAVAQWGADHRKPNTLFNLFYFCIGRTLQRLDRLAARWQAGEDLRPRRPATPRSRKPEEAKAPAPRLPTGRMWLVKLVQPEPWTVNQWSGVVAQLFADPDTRALVEAAPQAGRILRPLARMFDTELPDWLQLPKRPRKPRPPKPRVERPESRTARIRRYRRMTGAELYAHFHPIPPHFNLPIPGWRSIRRKIQAYEAQAHPRPIKLIKQNE